MDNAGASNSEYLESTIIHEACHVRDYNDDIFLRAIRLELTDDPKKYFSNKTNIQITEEYSAILGEMEYSASKKPVIEHLLCSSSDQIIQDLGHDIAKRLLIDDLVDFCFDDPNKSKYGFLLGINTKKGKTVDTKVQFRMQISSLVNKPEILSEIARKLREEMDYQRDYSRYIESYSKTTSGLGYPQILWFVVLGLVIITILGGINKYYSYKKKKKKKKKKIKK